VVSERYMLHSQAHETATSAATEPGNLASNGSRSERDTVPTRRNLPPRGAPSPRCWPIAPHGCASGSFACGPRSPRPQLISFAAVSGIEVCDCTLYSFGLHSRFIKNT